MKIYEIKKKIIKSLEGKRILSCPKCNHTTFLRKSWGRVEVIEEEKNITDTLVDGFEEYEYECAKCGEDIEELNG